MLTSKIWRIINFNVGTTNCFNCDHSNKDSWDDDKGICDLISGLPFAINKFGICRFHSGFGGGNIKRDILFKG